MSTVAENEVAIMIPPFGIMIDHPRNCDCLLQSIPGVRLRSRITAMRTTRDVKSGEERVPTDQAKHLGMFPEVPGMQLHVNPKTLAYRITDPLCDDPALCDRLRKRISETMPFNTGATLKGVPVQEGTLDVHRIKTLVREMVNLVASGEAVVCRGTIPEMAEVEGLPGKFLLNPGSQVANSQPVYEADYEEWKAQLVRAGG